MMSRTLSVTESVEMHFTDCPTCGVLHGFPKSIYDQMALRPGPAGAHVHCPNGHRWHRVMETEADKWRRQAERAQQEIARLEDEKRMAERRAKLAQEQAARVTRRATAAVCPCCNRSFSQLARHMKAKHPEVAPFKPMPAGRKVRA